MDGWMRARVVRASGIDDGRARARRGRGIVGIETRGWIERSIDRDGIDRFARARRRRVSVDARVRMRTGGRRRWVGVVRVTRRARVDDDDDDDDDDD